MFKSRLLSACVFDIEWLIVDYNFKSVPKYKIVVFPST